MFYNDPDTWGGVGEKKKEEEEEGREREGGRGGEDTQRGEPCPYHLLLSPIHPTLTHRDGNSFGNSGSRIPE